MSDSAEIIFSVVIFGIGVGLVKAFWGFENAVLGVLIFILSFMVTKLGE